MLSEKNFLPILTVQKLNNGNLRRASYESKDNLYDVEHIHNKGFTFYKNMKPCRKTHIHDAIINKYFKG